MFMNPQWEQPFFIQNVGDIKLESVFPVSSSQPFARCRVSNFRGWFQLSTMVYLA